MESSEKMRSMVKQITAIVMAHAALSILSFYAHGKIDDLFLLMGSMPIAIITCLAPVVAALSLPTRSARYGAVALLGILPAELFFNTYTRFTALPSYNILEPALIWRILYEGSFGAILILEAIAFWLTFKLLLDIHRQIDSPQERQM